MTTVSFTHTEINPIHSEGSGGGIKSQTITEQSPVAGAGAGGGRLTLVETEPTPNQMVGAGGGRKVLVLKEFAPVLSLPLPDVTSGRATDIGLIEATINGFLEDDGGMLCSCAFEWGLTDSYGKVTPGKDKTAGEHFSQVLTGLEPDTVYHFRAIAYNVFGLIRGMDRTFRTLSETQLPYFQGPLMSLLEEEI